MSEHLNRPDPQGIAIPSTPEQNAPDSVGSAAAQPTGTAQPAGMAQPTTPQPTVAGLDNLDWRQVHKATPFIRGWLVIVAIIFGGMNSFGQGMVDSDETGDVGIAPAVDRWEILILLGVAVAALLIAIVYGYLAWRRMRFAYDDESVYMNSGIVFRQERKVRLDRIQSIDIVRPVIARILGLAELTISSAAGGESNVKIGFLKESEANQLRVEILARASGVVAAERAKLALATGNHTGPGSAPGGGLTVGATDRSGRGVTSEQNPQLDQQGFGAAQAIGQDYDSELAPRQPDQRFGAPQSVLFQESTERVIYQVPPSRIIGGGLLSMVTIFALLFVIAIVVLFIVGQPGIGISLLPGLLGFGPAAWNNLIGEYGFTGAISADGIRVRHGLLETRSKTIPPGRVQAVRIRQNALWRGPNWWRVDVNVAGQAVESSGNSVSMESVLLPVGTTVEAVDALWLVLPDLGIEDPLAVLGAAMTGKGTDHGFTVSPKSARWLDPLSFRRNGYLETDRALIFRTGWLIRKVIVIPHERTQSIGAKQGPLQRKLGLATFAVHSTPGAIFPAVPHQSLENVRELLAEQAERARQARASAGPEKWLEQVTQEFGNGESRRA